jgi:hypothetical protein
MAAWIESKTHVVDIASLSDAMAEASEVKHWPALPLWRGHADASWLVKPEIFRKPVREGVESGLLHSFVTRGASRTANAPAPDDSLGWLHLAQHYGLPTRLLDWSAIALTALYFVVRDESEFGVDGALWALSAGYLNAQVLDYSRIVIPRAAQVKEIAAAAFQDRPVPDLKPVIAISAQENDIRMLVQNAAFTIHDSPDDLQQFASPKPILLKFIVPAASKSNLKRWLRAFGASEATLFPDLAALADELKAVFF